MRHEWRRPGLQSEYNESGDPMSTMESRNPACPSEVVGTFEPTTSDQVSAKIAVASEAQLQWAVQPAAERATVVGAVAHALARQTHELVELIVREVGKTTREAAVEVRKATEQFHFASQLAYLAEGTTYPVEDPGTFAYTLRVPVGVVAAITPWNFPLSLAARKMATALALGNAVVFKPSPVAGVVGEFLARTAHEAGIPSEVLQLVHGDEPAAMAALLGDRRLRAVSFTGSDAVGTLVHRDVHRFARLQLELGGRNAAVVAADADIEKAATDIAAAAFGQCGQTCTSTDQVLVAADVYRELCDALARRVSAMVVGPGDRGTITCGPVATSGQLQRLQRIMADAESAGARCLARGTVLDGVDPEGYWLAPALYDEVPAGQALVEEEVFGPALSVRRVAGMAEAIDVINAGDHGLVASLHTTDMASAQQFAYQVTCGIVKINGRTTGNGIAPPFGGWKRSSSGAFPEGGRGGVEFFTETKTVYASWATTER